MLVNVGTVGVAQAGRVALHRGDSRNSQVGGGGAKANNHPCDQQVACPMLSGGCAPVLQKFVGAPQQKNQAGK